MEEVEASKSLEYGVVDLRCERGRRARERDGGGGRTGAAEGGELREARRRLSKNCDANRETIRESRRPRQLERPDRHRHADLEHNLLHLTPDPHGTQPSFGEVEARQ